MIWRDVIDLISVSHSEGAVVIVTETTRTVFANKKSVARSEFYQAIANDLKPNATFEIRVSEYADEQKLRHDGKDYLIIRTYSKNGETVELTCQAYDDLQTNLARLRNTIEIWHNTFIENSMGEMSPKPELICTVPASIEYKGGSSSSMDGITETTNNVTVTIRYRDGITPDMYLMIDGKRHDIKYIEDPFNRHETLILTAERVIP